MDAGTTVANDISQVGKLTREWWAKGVVSAALVAALYLEVIADFIVEWWTVPASSYGILIPPLVVSVAYMKRKMLYVVPAEPDLRGVRLAGPACFSCWPAIWRPNFSWRVSRLCRYWWGLHGLSGVSAA
jgi:hypothetical protein